MSLTFSINLKNVIHIHCIQLEVKIKDVHINPEMSSRNHEIISLKIKGI